MNTPPHPASPLKEREYLEKELTSVRERLGQGETIPDKELTRALIACLQLQRPHQLQELLSQSAPVSLDSVWTRAFLCSDTTAMKCLLAHSTEQWKKGVEGWLEYYDDPFFKTREEAFQTLDLLSAHLNAEQIQWLVKQPIAREHMPELERRIESQKRKQDTAHRPHRIEKRTRLS